MTVKKTTAAIVAAGLLLLGGGSYALWSDTVDAPTINVTTGHLDLAKTVESYWDISPYQGPKGDGTFTYTDGSAHVIASASAFRFSPGDKVRVVLPVQADIEGTNLQAKLTTTIATGLGGHGFTVANAGITKTFNSTTGVIGALETASPANVYNLSADQNYYVLYEISFTDEDTNGITSGDNMDYTLQDVLKGTTVKLEQVRTGA